MRQGPDGTVCNAASGPAGPRGGGQVRACSRAPRGTRGSFPEGRPAPYLGHVQRCGVAVVQPHALEMGGGDFRVFSHVRPEVRAVLGPAPVAQLHAVSPANELPPEVNG